MIHWLGILHLWSYLTGSAPVVSRCAHPDLKLIVCTPDRVVNVHLDGLILWIFYGPGCSTATVPTTAYPSWHEIEWTGNASVSVVAECPPVATEVVP